MVAEAGDASSGLEAARRIAPEAVLLDVRLPDGNGFDVCQELTDGDPELAVLLVSTDEQSHRAGHLRACGARGFVMKSRLARADLIGLLGGARDH